MADMKKIMERRRRNAMISEVTGVRTTGRRQTEHSLQVKCIRWLRSTLPTLKDVLFAVPNGGVRDELTQKILKEEGQTNGVADLILLKWTPRWGSLCIEMKSPTGRQSKWQKQWQKACELTGRSKYVVPHSLDDFRCEVMTYVGSIEPREDTLAADRKILIEYAEAMEQIKQQEPELYETITQKQKNER